MKVQIVDGCGQYSLITFDLRGSQSNLMKQWFPHRYEVACAKSTKKANKLERKGGKRYAKAVKKMDEACAYTGPQA